VNYKLPLIEVRQTVVFQSWLRRLRDQRAVDAIVQRIARLEAGLFGDAKPVGHGISELRISYGSGYRLYFVQRGSVLIVLLCGGDKRTQRRDIEKAQALANDLET
jgi:putative addiction module killer protein